LSRFSGALPTSSPLRQQPPPIVIDPLVKHGSPEHQTTPSGDRPSDEGIVAAVAARIDAVSSRFGPYTPGAVAPASRHKTVNWPR
jgi:hypothetical protein